MPTLLTCWNFRSGDSTQPCHRTFSSNVAPSATSPPREGIVRLPAEPPRLQAGQALRSRAVIGANNVMGLHSNTVFSISTATNTILKESWPSYPRAIALTPDSKRPSSSTRPQSLGSRGIDHYRDRRIPPGLRGGQDPGRHHNRAMTTGANQRVNSPARPCRGAKRLRCNVLSADR